MSNTIFIIDTTDRYIDTWGEEAREQHYCCIEVSCEPYNDGFLYDVDSWSPNAHYSRQYETREEAERKVRFLLGIEGIDADVKFAPEMERGAKETCAVMFRERGVSKHEIVQRVVYTCGRDRYIKWRGWWCELDADNIARL